MEDAIRTDDPIETTTKHALADAGRRAATMLFANIETAAAKGIEDTSRIFDLATAYKNVSDSLPLDHESTVTNLRNELQAANDEVAEVRAQLSQMTEARAELFAELNSVDALLSYAKTWTTYTTPIVTHNQRKDVIKSLAERAEALHGVQDAIAKTELDKRVHPANAVATLIMQRNEACVELAAISKQLPADAAKVVQERNALRAELATVKSADTLRHAQAQSRLAAVVGELVDLMSFWRRGDAAYRIAVISLEKHLKAALGDAYQPLVDRARVHRDAGTTTRPDDVGKGQF